MSESVSQSVSQVIPSGSGSVNQSEEHVRHVVAMLRCFRTEQFGSSTKGRRYPYSGKLRQELSGAQWLELTPVLSQMDTPDDVDDAADLDSEVADADGDGPVDAARGWAAWGASSRVRILFGSFLFGPWGFWEFRFQVFSGID